MKPPKNVPKPPNWTGSDEEFYVIAAYEGHIEGDISSDESDRDPLVTRGE